MRWLLLIFIAACGGSSYSSMGGGGRQGLVVQAVGIQSTAIAAPGGMLHLAAYESVSGPYGESTLQQVTANWSSSNIAVATVDQDGLVAGNANGSAVITATAGSATGETTVTVGATPASVTIEWNLGAETSPLTTTIAAGTPVQWHASDTNHTVVSDAAPPPATVPVNQGTTTPAQTIATKGTYHYHCSIHPAMRGTLVVQ